MKLKNIPLKTGKIAAKTAYKSGYLLIKSIWLLTRGMKTGVKEAYTETKTPNMEKP
jgi:hypothetical protein